MSACASSTRAPTPPAAPGAAEDEAAQGGSELPADMMRLLAKLAQTTAELDRIWPSFRPSERAYGVFRPTGNVLLLRRGDPPEGFAPVSDRHDVPELDEIAWYRERPLDDLTQIFYINRDMGGFTATLIRADLLEMVEFAEAFETLIHEDFHGHQRTRFEGERTSTVQHADLGDAPQDEIIASLELERRLLVDALDRSDAKERREAILDYIALRQHRERVLPPAFTEAEHRIETFEGTATWVGMRAAESLGASDAPSAEAQIEERLARPFEELGQSPSQRLLSSRIYGTGAAIAELLERDHAKTWQGVIEEGRDLYRALIELAAADPDALSGRAAAIRGSERFRDLVEWAGTVDMRDPRERLLAETAWAVDVKLPGAAGRDGEALRLQSFSAAVSLPRADGGLFLGELREADLATDRATMRVEGTPIELGGELDEGAPAGATRSLTVFTGRPPAGPDGPLGPGTHRIRADDLELQGVDIQADDELTIRVRNRR